MSETEGESKSIRIPTFNGNEDQYQKWWIRFKAYAKLAGFSKALVDTPEADLPGDNMEAEALTGSDDATVKKRSAVLRNDKAISSFTLAFETNELLDMVIESQSTEWPEGQAWTVVKKLQKKYRPCDTMAMVDERIALNEIKMKKNEDPSKLFERIKAVETKYNTKTRKISEADKIAVVISQALRAYRSILTAEQRA